LFCETTKNLLFYQITVDDFNQNGTLDKDDPNYLFMSDENGENLQQISPDKIDVRDWKFLDKEHSLVEIDGKTDSNNDGTFDGHDREFLYLIDLNEPENSHEIFPKAFQDSLKKKYVKRLTKNQSSE
jgi:hypothetical protein